MTWLIVVGVIVVAVLLMRTAARWIDRREMEHRLAQYADYIAAEREAGKQ